jgi:hypothetical protein
LDQINSAGYKREKRNKNAGTFSVRTGRGAGNPGIQLNLVGSIIIDVANETHKKSGYAPRVPEDHDLQRLLSALRGRHWNGGCCKDGLTASSSLACLLRCVDERENTSEISQEKGRVFVETPSLTTTPLAPPYSTLHPFVCTFGSCGLRWTRPAGFCGAPHIQPKTRRAPPPRGTHGSLQNCLESSSVGHHGGLDNGDTPRSKQKQQQQQQQQQLIITDAKEKDTENLISSFPNARRSCLPIPSCPPRPPRCASIVNRGGLLCWS